MKTKTKPCKHCDRTTHFSFQCFQNPKREVQIIKAKQAIRKPLPKTGKVTKEWLEVRDQWFKEHPAQYYTCELRISPLCHKIMPKNETTLDHTIPKSNAKNFGERHNFSNLKPACYPCNSLKGSKKSNS